MCRFKLWYKVKMIPQVNASDMRISSLEYELQSIKAQATRSIDGPDKVQLCADPASTMGLRAQLKTVCLS